MGPGPLKADLLRQHPTAEMAAVIVSAAVHNARLSIRQYEEEQLYMHLIPQEGHARRFVDPGGIRDK